MKRKITVLALSLALLVCGLSACMKKEPPRLSGTYSAETHDTAMRYTFQEDTVTAQYSVMGYEIAKQEGAYAINDEDGKITFTFDAAQIENASLPEGMTSLGGTFTFQRGDGYIVIGGTRYDQVIEAEEIPPAQDAAPTSSAPSADPDQGGV